MTSNGVEVQFSWNSSTNTLEGTADGQPVINIHVDVYDYGAGSYTEAKIELFDNLDHPIGAEGESLGTEDNLGITLNYTATDADGDQAYGSFDLSIDDDMPVIGTPEAVSVDEEGIDGNAGDSFLYHNEAPFSTIDNVLIVAQCQIELLFFPLHYFHSFRDGLGVKKSILGSILARKTTKSKYLSIVPFICHPGHP